MDKEVVHQAPKFSSLNYSGYIANGYTLVIFSVSFFHQTNLREQEKLKTQNPSHM
jgi:hypothetical protein